MLWLASAALFCLCRAQQKDFFQFVTRPDIGALTWDIHTYDRDALQPGYYWFISPYLMLQETTKPKWQGPYIYDGNGQLVWSGAPLVQHSNTFDFRMSIVNGQQMLSFIGPPLSPKGNGIILDNTYRVHEIVDMVGNHSIANIHEFNLIDDGSHVLMAIKQEYRHPTRISVDEYEGPCKVGWQGFKEVVVKTSEVVFEWSTRGHIDVEETSFVGKHIKINDWEHKCAHEWDITHINAVDKFDDGDYLISARHTDTIYKVSHKDGSIVWRLGGSRSDFVPKDQRARFSRQHHARFRGQNETHTLISLFDNATGSGSVEEKVGSTSYGLYLALRTDVMPMEVDVIAQFAKPLARNEHDSNHAFSSSRGSVSFMPNGNAFINWVYGSHIAEYSPEGRLLMSAVLSKGEAASYRSYKMPWIGRPAYPPDVVARAVRDGDEDLKTLVYVSWNGDTEVVTWNVLQTNLQGNISQLVASAPRAGFETSFAIDSFAKYIMAVGLDNKGEELGRSRVIHTAVPPQLQSLTATHVGDQWVGTHLSVWWDPSAAKIFIITFVLGIIVFCIGLGLWMRRTAGQSGSWWCWGSQVSSYEPVDTEERMMDKPEWVLEKKEEHEVHDEEEAKYSSPIYSNTNLT